MERQYLKLAHQQRMQGNSAQAIKTIELALAQEPDNSEAHSLLAMCLYDEYVDRRQFSYLQRSLTSARTAIAANPDNAEAHYILGMAALAQGSMAQGVARKHLEQALIIHPENPVFISALADYYASQNKNKQAMELYEKALSDNPGSLTTLNALARYYFDKGKIAKAKEFTIRALEEAPSSVQTHLMMGNIAYREGDVELAKEHAGFALANNPGDYQTLFLLCAVTTHKSFLMRNIFRLMRWTSASDSRYAIFVPIVLVVCSLIAALPKQIGIISREHIYALVLIFALYIIFKPFFYMRKLKKKFLQDATLRDDF